MPRIERTIVCPTSRCPSSSVTKYQRNKEEHGERERKKRRNEYVTGSASADASEKAFSFGKGALILSRNGEKGVESAAVHL